MLKSIIFLLVIISLLTTPTRAYEAYNISDFSIYHLKSVELKKTAEILRSLHSSLVISKTNKPVSKTESIIADNMCQNAIDYATQTYDIKPKLLETIALVESGRYSKIKNKRVSWPWTIQFNGKGYFYKTKAEAVTALNDLQQQGYTNIDIGCMQINLKYHAHAFNSIEDMLDPKQNVEYSAKFLKKLYQKNNDWQKTAMQYHSKNQEKGLNYKIKLEKHYAKHIDTNQTSTLF